MKVVVISGSPRKNANTEIMMKYVYEYTKNNNNNNVDTTFLNLSERKMECFHGFDKQYNEDTTSAAKELVQADVWLIGTPIYNSFFSGALKNLFEFVDYKKTAGKTAGMAILAAGHIGFTDVQTLLTQLLSYFRVVANPKPVFMTTDDIIDGMNTSDAQERLREMVDNTLNMATKLASSNDDGGQ